ncbi:MAG: hypothetical protein HYT12_02720 [Candidatus Liptonbacteria bacterium]|nr:hypothetical protein [Candidatus Liptonbacteria bacterium]
MFFEDTIEKKRKLKKEIVWFAIIFIVSTTSFALGFLVAGEFNSPPIIIEKGLLD